MSSGELVCFLVNPVWIHSQLLLYMPFPNDDQRIRISFFGIVMTKQYEPGKVIVFALIMHACTLHVTGSQE